ncbi:MAG: hypothetical protein QOH25_152 [Acidobacteriota bacterium]|jgi:hypothetical protein|nr:hypothetical protein [Acidobacteriota bacterium]
MHCPQCGQHQISGEVHFCKSCGFPLDRIKELLASDSIPPAIEKESQEPGESPRRKGVRQGVKLFFICLVLAALTTRMGNGRADFLPMMFFMAALMRILYAVVFQEGAPRKKKKQDGPLPSVPITTEQLGTATRGTALPPAQSVPVAAFNAHRVDTREIVNPPSVTEHTTKLLNESQDSK